mmetsp:Transcript_54470/g.174674  ORF Transcript_54470/g.174674 Transcript_54470/m.174674 type:complete len:138 (-) Transcript_54470:1184-1597(-)
MVRAARKVLRTPVVLATRAHFHGQGELLCSLARTREPRRLAVPAPWLPMQAVHMLCAGGTASQGRSAGEGAAAGRLPGGALHMQGLSKQRPSWQRPHCVVAAPPMAPRCSWSSALATVGTRSEVFQKRKMAPLAMET